MSDIDYERLNKVVDVMESYFARTFHGVASKVLFQYTDPQPWALHWAKSGVTWGLYVSSPADAHNTLVRFSSAPFAVRMTLATQTTIFDTLCEALRNAREDRAAAVALTASRLEAWLERVDPEHPR